MSLLVLLFVGFAFGLETSEWHATLQMPRDPCDGFMCQNLRFVCFFFFKKTGRLLTPDVDQFVHDTRQDLLL